MKIVLTTLNSKFIHSNLALRDLKAYCGDAYGNIRIMEFTINDHYEQIIAGLVSQQPDLLCFSCYIWNIRQTLDIIGSIKKILSDCRILLGGPEVSYDGEELMAKYPFIDYIAVGEGEETFRELLDCLAGYSMAAECERFSPCAYSPGSHDSVQNPAGLEYKLSRVKGLIWRRDDGEAVYNGDRSPIPLDSVPFAYESGFQGLSDRIIYYETSRGCPYRCQYCLSSTTGHVRFLSMERVKRELAFFVRSGVRQVKLVDRTFNCNPARAREIFQYLIGLGGNTNFHMEMAGDLIDEAMLKILARAPVGMFQFEIGIQSTNESTLNAIQRKTNLSRIKQAVSEILSMDNIHVHLDLIAGLPEEDLEALAHSINEVLELRPHRLQLGFLKLLKGSGLRASAGEFECCYTEYPPYEILSNHALSFQDLARLKRIEKLLELYYNSHRFDCAMDYLFHKAGGDCFRVLDNMADYWQEHGYFNVAHSSIRLYEILAGYAAGLDSIEKKKFLELLRFDYARHERPSRYPNGLEPDMDENTSERIRSFFSSQENIKQLLPDLYGQSPKQILRCVHVEVFQYSLEPGCSLGGQTSGQKEMTAILFDYRHRTGVLRKANAIRIRI